ncbi:hypothetical protein ALC60_09664 [Trachymyrmex zeteki]|uniref:Uncharacterized protein n=1 Tax=Mycetomoellerius zeteki TaxID=64791 RepID=A0A151WTG8_9HYME|nr:hypothetical protein ALC60_09664 [Trachymyrmex zeteki]
MLDDVAETMIKSSGQLKTKSRDRYQKFTVVREAAAEANARTSAETERSLPRSLTHLSDERAFSSNRIYFLLGYKNLKTHVVIVALSLISACSRNLCGRFEKGFYVMHTAHSAYLIITGFEDTAYYCKIYLLPYQQTNNCITSRMQKCQRTIYDGLSVHLPFKRFFRCAERA